MAAFATDIAKFITLLRNAMKTGLLKSDASYIGEDLLTTIQDSSLSTTQTLSNKTLTSPVINTGTIGTSLLPTTNDGAALGASGTAFSDLYLASGGVINWNAGNVGITHNNAGTFLLVNPGDLRVTTANVGTNADSVPTLSSTSTLTNKTLTAPIFSSSPTGDGVTQWAEVSITNAEMLALRAAPKTLVAAPASGKVLEFVSLQLFFDYTAAYTETADNMAVKYENGSGAAVSQTIEATGFVDAAADTITNGLPKIDAIVAGTGAINKALVLHNTGDGEYGGGDAANVVRAKISYRVWTTGF